MDSLRIEFRPGGKVVRIPCGGTVLDAAVAAGVDLNAVCGGNGICGKCRIRVISENSEDGIVNDRYALACRTVPQDDCVVEVPQAQVEDSLAPGQHACGILKHLEPDSISVKRPGDAHDKHPGPAGIAVDIGTTTVAGVLCRLDTGEISAFKSMRNPQTRVAGDVIGRISHARNGDGLNKLCAMVRECVSNLTQDLCTEAGILSSAIEVISVAGNSTMLHLFAGESPASLGQAPFEPAFMQHKPVPASEYGIDTAESCMVNFLPNIAGFVGGDTVAGILATDLHGSGNPRMLIDIGTNGEIVLSNEGQIFTCSAAAGPAFEGGRISHGMRAVPGAITDVIFGDDLQVITVNGDAPLGICGSGLIRTVAGMLDSGFVDTGGHLVRDLSNAGIPGNLSGRFRNGSRGRKFVLWEDADENREISLSEKDISELMLAKAAIRAAAEMLLRNCGIGWGDLEKIYFAGAFGSSLRVSDMRRIGLVPGLSCEMEFAGNTSLTGCLMTVLNRNLMELAVVIASSARFVELASNNQFQDYFTGSLTFE